MHGERERGITYLPNGIACSRMTVTHFNAKGCLESVPLIKRDHNELRGYRGDLWRYDLFLPTECSCSLGTEGRRRKERKRRIVVVV